MAEKVTKIIMEALKPGGRAKVFRATSVADFQSQLRTAYYVKQKHPRSDGVYEISNSAVGMTITVRVKKKEATHE